MIKAFVSAISALVSRLTGALSSLRLQRFAAVALVGMIMLTTSIDNADLSSSTKAMLNDMVARGENGRPVTTAQWQAENRKLQGEPGKQAERIAVEAADAVGEMAEIYPGNIESVLPGMSNDELERDD